MPLIIRYSCSQSNDYFENKSDHVVDSDNIKDYIKNLYEQNVQFKLITIKLSEYSDYEPIYMSPEINRNYNLHIYNEGFIMTHDDNVRRNNILDVDSTYVDEYTQDPMVIQQIQNLGEYVHPDYLFLIKNK